MSALTNMTARIKAAKKLATTGYVTLHRLLPRTTTVVLVETKKLMSKEFIELSGSIASSEYGEVFSSPETPQQASDMLGEAETMLNNAQRLVAVTQKLGLVITELEARKRKAEDGR